MNKLKPLTSESPTLYVCDECMDGFKSMSEPTYCPFCGGEL